MKFRAKDGATSVPSCGWQADPTIKCEHFVLKLPPGGRYRRQMFYAYILQSIADPTSRPRGMTQGFLSHSKFRRDWVPGTGASPWPRTPAPPGKDPTSV